MSLSLKSERTRGKIAKQDIVTYKKLTTKWKVKDEYVGKPIPFKALISDRKTFGAPIEYVEVSGVLCIYEKYIWLCHNNPRFNGSSVPDKQGYLYSWFYDQRVRMIDPIEKYLDKMYRTPYMDTEVKIGETYKSKLVKNRNWIGQGLHSIEKRKDLGSAMGDICVECVIPKGSFYYCGLHANYIPAFASDTLIYTKILEE